MIKTATPPGVQIATTSAVRQNWLGEVARQLAWLVCSVLFLMVLLEIVFACAHVGEEEYLASDTILGSSHLPNKMVTFRSEGYSQGRINSAGFRDFEYALAKPTRTLRIAVLGDSVTEGLQVPLGDTYAKVLERQLISKYGNHFQVLNFAMSGYGTGQEYVQLLHQVSKYHPDMVLLAYQVGDSDDNILQPGVEEPVPRPYFGLNGKGQLVIDWSALNNWQTSDRGRWFQLTDWLRQNSRTVAVLSRLQLSLNSDKSFQSIRKLGSKLTASGLRMQSARPVATQTLAAQKRISNCVVELPRPVVDTIAKAASAHADPLFAVYAQAADASWQLTAEIIRQLNYQCRTQQCKLVVVGLPAPNNCFFYFRELKALEKLSAQEGFRFIDVHTKFPPRAPMEKSPYYLDYHLSQLGHQRVAQNIGDSLWAN